MKPFFKQSGFTGLEVALLTAVLLTVGAVAFFSYQGQYQEPAQPAPATQEAPADEQETNSGGTSEDEAIIAAAKAFCLEQGGTSCDGTVERKKGSTASVKTSSMLVLVTETNGTWRGVLANDTDSDICMTGTSSPTLAEFCKAN